MERTKIIASATNIPSLWDGTYKNYRISYQHTIPLGWFVYDPLILSTNIEFLWDAEAQCNFFASDITSFRM